MNVSERLQAMGTEPSTSGTLTFLAGDAIACAVQVQNVSGRKIALMCPSAAAIGARVRLDWSDKIVLAEVAATQQNASGEWLHTLAVTHLLKRDDIEHVQRRWSSPQGPDKAGRA